MGVGVEPLARRRVPLGYAPPVGSRDYLNRTILCVSTTRASRNSTK